AAALDPNTPSHWNRLTGTNIYLRKYSDALLAVEHEFALSPNAWRCEWLRALIPMQWKGDLSAFEHLRPPPEGGFGLWLTTKLFLHRFDEAEALVRNDPRETLPGFGLAAAPKSLYFAQLYTLKNEKLKAREQFEAALPIVERATFESPLRA